METELGVWKREELLHDVSDVEFRFLTVLKKKSIWAYRELFDELDIDSYQCRTMIFSLEGRGLIRVSQVGRSVAYKFELVQGVSVIQRMGGEDARYRVEACVTEYAECRT